MEMQRVYRIYYAFDGPSFGSSAYSGAHSSDLKRRKAFVAPFILIRNDGKTWVYYDLSELAAAARDAKIYIRAEFWYFYGFGSIFFRQGGMYPSPDKGIRNNKCSKH